MAREISLNLKINGVQQGVKSINDLEQAIVDAEEQLKGLDIGSQAFKDLARDVNIARSTLKDLELQFEGQDITQRVGAFVSVGESIVTSFAGAQASLALFGAESEDVAEAATAAQNALTVVLSARAAVEGVLQVRIAATTIAQLASNAATTASIGLTRTLYRVIAANPYGAIIAAVGALVTAYLALRNTQEDVVDITKELNEAQSDEAATLRNQLTILTQFNGLKNIQLKTINELKETYPGFNALLNEENQLTEQGTEFLKLKIEQYELEAKAQVILQAIKDVTNKQLEDEQNGLENNISFYDRFINRLQSFGNEQKALARDLIDGYQNQQEASANYQRQLDGLLKQLENIFIQQDRNLEKQKEYNSILNQRTRAEELQVKLNEAFRSGLRSVVDYAEGIDQLNKEVDKLREAFDRLEGENYEVKIIEDLQRIKDLRLQNIQGLNNAIDTFLESYSQLTQVLPNEDEFIRNFRSFREALEREFVQGTGNFDNVTRSVFGNLETLTQQQRIVIRNLQDAYQNFFTFLRRNEGLLDAGSIFQQLQGLFETGDGDVISEFDGIARALGDLLLNLGEVRKTFDETGQIVDVPFDVDRVRESARTAQTVLENSLIIPTIDKLESLKREALLIQKETLEIKLLDATLTKEESDNIQIEIENIKGQLVSLANESQRMREDVLSIPPGVLLNLDSYLTLTDEVKNTIRETIDQFLEFGGAIVGFEQGVISVNEEVNKFIKELTDAQLGKALAGFVTQNISVISDLLIGARTKAQQEAKAFEEKVRADAEGLEQFKQKLLEEGFINELTRNEDLLNAYIEYKRRELEVTKEVEDEKQAVLDQTTQAVVTGFQEVSATLSEITSLTNERLSANLERLNLQREQALERVVGESEQAAQKRLEIEEEFQERTKQLEKQARLSALRLTLAQAIANSAAASIRAVFELGPIAGPIAAAVNAVLLAAQVSNIQEQISTIQSFRRGGLLASRGLLLSGPSHEDGGISLAQYGVIAEGRESIINRQSTMNYAGLLSSINQSGGGRPLVVNNFDDSRIVEAIAEQKELPLRAYVIEQDITNSQALNNRLDKLSQL